MATNNSANQYLAQFYGSGVPNTGIDPYANCPELQALRCLQATVEDFVCFWGEKESVELTNMDNPGNNVINTKRIEIALEDAFAYILNYWSAASAAAKVLIQSSLRRTMLVLARYYLDSIRPRQHVIDQAEKAIQQLNLWIAQSGAQNLNKYNEAYRFYRESPQTQGVSLVSGIYERGRKFTHATLEPWVEGIYSNDEWQLSRYYEQRLMPHYRISGGIGNVSPTGTQLPDELQAVNALYDALDNTVSVGSHEETASEAARTPEDDSILALNPVTEPVDDTDPDAPFNFTF